MRRLPFLAALLSVFITGCASSVDPSNLGTAAPSSFLQTNASIAVINVFDMYCHTCQTEAPHIVKLQKTIKQRSGGTKVQFYALGWGNTPLEAETYRTRFNVPFPVIPDRDLSISNRYGTFRPPMLIALRREGGTWKEFYRTQHIIGRSDEVANAILR